MRVNECMMFHGIACLKCGHYDPRESKHADDFAKEARDRFARENKPPVFTGNEFLLFSMIGAIFGAFVHVNVR